MKSRSVHASGQLQQITGEARSQYGAGFSLWGGALVLCLSSLRRNCFAALLISQLMYPGVDLTPARKSWCCAEVFLERILSRTLRTGRRLCHLVSIYLAAGVITIAVSVWTRCRLRGNSAAADCGTGKWVRRVATISMDVGFLSFFYVRP